MNFELFKKKMDDYFATLTPNDVVNLSIEADIAWSEQTSQEDEEEN